MKKYKGFTLIELLITLVIVGILLMVGVPAIKTYMQSGQLIASTNELLSAFHLARSESSRAKTNITVCASANALAADANCGGTWDQGFIVFVDDDGDINRSGATETVLRAHGPIADSVNLAVENAATYFSYSSTGLGRINVGNNPAVSRIVMCDERGNITAAGGRSAARLFIATPLGRATVFNTKSLIDDALTDMGETCP